MMMMLWRATTEEKRNVNMPRTLVSSGWNWEASPPPPLIVDGGKNLGFIQKYYEQSECYAYTVRVKRGAKPTSIYSYPLSYGVERNDITMKSFSSLLIIKQTWKMYNKRERGGRSEENERNLIPAIMGGWARLRLWPKKKNTVNLQKHHLVGDLELVHTRDAAATGCHVVSLVVVQTESLLVLSRSFLTLLYFLPLLFSPYTINFPDGRISLNFHRT